RVTRYNHGLLEPADGKLDPFLAHAAMQTLRRCQNWPAVLRLLDLPENKPVRGVALRAVANQYVPQVVSGLIARLADDDADRRRQYADALSRVCRQAGPWEYWGYRPAPRAAPAVAWQHTAAIEQALALLLVDPDRAVRLAVLRRMQREKIAVPLDKLAAWLNGGTPLKAEGTPLKAAERDEEAVAAILTSLPGEPADQRRALLRQLIVDRNQGAANRMRALHLLQADSTPPSAELLREMIGALEDGPVLAELLRPFHAAIGKEAIALLVQKLSSASAEVRAAAVQALADAGSTDAGPQITRLLEDHNPLVRRAAAAAVGRLHYSLERSTFGPAVESLLKLARDPDVLVRCAALESLGQLRAASAAPLAAAALDDRETQLSALACLVQTGGPEHADDIIKLAGADSSEAVALLSVRALTKWRARGDVTAERRAEMERAIERLQGSSGLVLHWHVRGPLTTETLGRVQGRLLATKTGESFRDDEKLWQSIVAASADGRVAAPGTSTGKQSWLAWADVTVGQATAAQFVAAAGGELQVWINGRPAYQRQLKAEVPRDFVPYSDFFDGTLTAGRNRLVIRVTAAGGQGTPLKAEAEFQLRFRRKSSTAKHEQFVQAALSRTGDIQRGRQLFLDAARTQCLKCHRVESVGERIGPELIGLGDRFSRIHIVESILEPSRTVTPGFQTLLVRATDGQTFTGIKIAEDERTLTLADAKGDKLLIAKDQIEAQQPQAKSTMPDGLVQQLTADQFVDLVTFLASQKQSRSQPPAGQDH
ncbi:MAG: HEAT repeat domain-containing protein, partial [Pirellulaceae bacterium]